MNMYCFCYRFVLLISHVIGAMANGSSLIIPLKVGYHGNRRSFRVSEHVDFTTYMICGSCKMRTSTAVTGSENAHICKRLIQFSGCSNTQSQKCVTEIKFLQSDFSLVLFSRTWSGPIYLRLSSYGSMFQANNLNLNGWVRKCILNWQFCVAEASKKGYPLCLCMFCVPKVKSVRDSERSRWVD